MNYLKFIVLLLRERFQQWKEERRKAAIASQELFVEQLECAYEMYPSPEYWHRLERERTKLDKIQRI